MRSRTSTTLLDGLEDPQNGHAWRRFFWGYTPMLASYAKRVGLSDADAQDVVAATLATFVEAYRAGRYDRKRARLKSWLGGIIQNKVRKLYSRRQPVLLDDLSFKETKCTVEPETADVLADAFEREWQLERLDQALEILRGESEPDTYQAFDLYAVKGWPVVKVASFLSTTANAVYIAKTRTIRRLRELVRQLGEDEE